MRGHQIAAPEFGLELTGGMSKTTQMSYSVNEIIFGPVTDVSGRVAAMNRDRELTKCQSIEVSQETTARTGASEPHIAPGPDLGCEYPYVSVRLQESGIVKLIVRVTPDGSVSDARVTEFARSARLNEAALRIAKTRLRFTPTVQDQTGTQDNVTINFQFNIVHPIHGVP
jgi:TonB family protein